MASIKHYANGLGGTTGSAYTTGADVQVSGKVYYLGNAITGNSDANTGLERNKPFATFAHAISVIAAADTLDILPNHAETLSGSVAIGVANIVIVGEGSGSSVPRFTCSGAVNMFNVTAACVYMENIVFPADTAVPTAALRIAGDDFTGKNLRFECGSNDTNRKVIFATAGATGPFTLDGCTFTAVAAQPAIALELTTSTAQLVLTNCTFDGGSFGWSDYALKASAGTFGIHIVGLQLLNGSDVQFPTSSNGFVQTTAATGDSRIDWTA
jgi:hypothetical protein